MWNQTGDFLTQEFVFKDFKKAFSFMMEVAFLAEEHGHHPNWSNVYNKVTIKLTTHDEGNQVTEKDWALARAIDQIVEGS